MIYKKITRMAKKVFSSKTYILVFVNRFMNDDFGKIVDLNIDRDEKNIFLELHKDKEVATVELCNYAMRYQGSKSFIVYDSLALTGYMKSILKSFTKTTEIEIEPRYIKLVESFVKA